MPGAYPSHWFKSQDHLDRFWNVRLGITTSALVAFVAATWTSYFLLNFLLGFVTGGIYLLLFFRLNIFGRIMMFVMGPYDPEDWK